MEGLHHGDCLEVMKDIADGSVDLTVTSPPYDNLRSYNMIFKKTHIEKLRSRKSRRKIGGSGDNR